MTPDQGKTLLTGSVRVTMAAQSPRRFLPMPKFFHALMATLLAVIVIFAVEVQSDPLAPDHVPKAPLVLALVLEPRESLLGIDDGKAAESDPGNVPIYAKPQADPGFKVPDHDPG